MNLMLGSGVVHPGSVIMLMSGSQSLAILYPFSVEANPRLFPACAGFRKPRFIMAGRLSVEFSCPLRMFYNARACYRRSGQILLVPTFEMVVFATLKSLARLACETPIAKYFLISSASSCVSLS